jgi:protein-L-isoaspartate(D-aspartate) O-methyltransferase
MRVVGKTREAERLSRSSLIFVLVALMVAGWSAPLCAQAAEKRFERLRQQMVDIQIRGRGVSHPELLRAMAAVPRHHFVPKAVQGLAYDDRALPIGLGQTISQPYVVALMTTLLDLESGQRALEIGTGSGYQAAVLAEMGVQVYTIEIVPELGRQAEKILADLGYAQVQVRIGDGFKGWPSEAPFDGIIVTCAPSRIPEPLKEQLAEGGRMVIPVGGDTIQQLVLLTRQHGRIEQQEIVDVRFVPMVDEKGRTY